MLTLSPGSSCDVCAEEYGPHCMPHCIPCGHVLCSSCCNNIVEKTSPRLSPACPFCREQFTTERIRLIRIDFSSNLWSAPRRRIVVETNDLPDELATRKEERILSMENGCSKTRADARTLEDKVAKVAAKKCSVEEVTTLHRELQDWLTSEVDDKTSSLYLSAALLRAILLNHLAHSESSKVAKQTEANLKARLDDMEITTAKLDAELRRQKLQYSQKAQECQNLAMELNRIKLQQTTGSIGQSPSRSGSVREAPPSSSASGSAAPLYAPTARSAVSRFANGSGHTRSASVQPPASSRSYTPMASSRSETPMPPHGTHRNTPTPRPGSSRSRQYASPSPPPPVPALPPLMMSRSSSSSSEDDQIHERWIPPHQHTPVSPTGSTSKSRFPFGPTSTASIAAGYHR